MLSLVALMYSPWHKDQPSSHLLGNIHSYIIIHTKSPAISLGMLAVDVKVMDGSLKLEAALC